MPDTSSFLRSINIGFDIADPSRIDHFRLTAKASTLLGSILGDDKSAILVTAPYGSGKSLTATCALQFVENTPAAQETLAGIARQAKRVNGSLHKQLKARLSDGVCGVAVALEGHVDSLPNALADAFAASLDRLDHRRGVSRRIQTILKSNPSPVQTLADLVDLCESRGLDRVVIVWDEFGRHLETLIREGRSTELHDVQHLAEFAARDQDVNCTFSVLLHQGFSAYASNASESVRKEWKKIEERFERLDYVDDSAELLTLLGDVIRDRSAQTRSKKTKGDVPATRTLQRSGLFAEYEPEIVDAMLKNAAPLEPAVLYLLPKIAARVAQNERTLFGFLHQHTWSEPVGFTDLYDFFEPSMVEDLGVGGTSRSILECRSALSKCVSDEEVTCIQAACLLAVGLAGSRAKLTRKLLVTALTGRIMAAKDAKKAVGDLVSRNLLLHRKHSDEIAVWHGTDSNLRERISDEIARLQSSFNVFEFLDAGWPLPAVTATEFNDVYRTRRFFTREFVSPSMLEDGLFGPALPSGQPLGDGRILHVVPTGSDDLEACLSAAQAASRNAGDLALVTVPTSAQQVSTAALEVQAILNLQGDRDLLDQDPLVADELRQFEDDAREHLARQLGLVAAPEAGLRWFHEGEEKTVKDLVSLRSLVSFVCGSVYHKTPVLPNEQVNRRKPSAPIVNARKKLVGAILESTGKPDFNFYGESGPREVGAAVLAQYRSIVKNTGLYRCDDRNRWGFAAPNSLSDPALGALWEEFRVFFTEPSKEPKSIDALFKKIQSKPYGVRAGLVPILFACAIRAFPVVGSLSGRDGYISDIRPTTVEEICRDPSGYVLNVLAVHDDQRDYLEGICELFRGSRAAVIDDPDLIRRAFEWIQFWKQDAPEAVRVAGGLSSEAFSARKVLWSTDDPVRVLLEALPVALGVQNQDFSAAMKRLKVVKAELDGVVEVYAERAMHIMLTAVHADATDPYSLPGLQRLQGWAASIPDEALDDISEPRAKGVVVQLGDPGEDPVRFVNMISARLTKAVSRWDDSEVAKFQQEFTRVVGLVEDATFSAARQGVISEDASSRVASLVKQRIEVQCGLLAEIHGLELAVEELESIIAGIQQGADRG